MKYFLLAAVTFFLDNIFLHGMESIDQVLSPDSRNDKKRTLEVTLSDKPQKYHRTEDPYPLHWDHYDFPKMIHLLTHRRNLNAHFLHQWMNAMENRYPLFLSDSLYTSCSFARTIYTLASATKHHPHLIKSILNSSTSWIQNWFDTTLFILPTFNPQSLSNTLYGFSKLSIVPPPYWLSSFFRVSQRTLHTFNPQDLSNLMYGFSKLNIRPPFYWKNSFLKQCRQHNSQFIPQDFINILYSFSLLEMTPKPSFTNHLKKLYPDFNMFALEEKNQLYLFHQYLSIKRKKAFLDQGMIDSWIEEFEREAVNNVSYLEKSVGKSLNPLFQSATFIPEIGSVVDFYDPTTRTIVQVDGPRHYLSNGEPNGSTLLQTRILESFGYRVIRINYQDWDQSKDHKGFLNGSGI